MFVVDAGMIVLLSSLSNGKCKATNILKSEDVISAIRCIRKLGVKVNLTHNACEIFGKGLNGFKPKSNTILYAGNSGTVARLICSILININSKIKITGDQSLKKNVGRR